jgi:hypothetical protein
VNFDQLKGRWDQLFAMVARDPNLPGTPQFERLVAEFDRDFIKFKEIDPQGYTYLKMIIDLQTGATRAIS